MYIVLLLLAMLIAAKRLMQSITFPTEVRAIGIVSSTIFMKIASAVLGGDLMTLCPPTPGTAQYIIFIAADFAVVFT